MRYIDTRNKYLIETNWLTVSTEYSKNHSMLLIKKKKLSNVIKKVPSE